MGSCVHICLRVCVCGCVWPCHPHINYSCSVSDITQERITGTLLSLSLSHFHLSVTLITHYPLHNQSAYGHRTITTPDPSLSSQLSVGLDLSCSHYPLLGLTCNPLCPLSEVAAVLFSVVSLDAHYRPHRGTVALGEAQEARVIRLLG